MVVCALCLCCLFVCACLMSSSLVAVIVFGVDGVVDGMMI